MLRLKYPVERVVPPVAKKSLLRSGLIVSASTFLSRILGMIRDIIIAHILGAGFSADVFLFANRIPNFFRRLFAEGAFNQAFVPVLSDAKAKGDEEARDLIASVMGTLGVIVAVVTVLGVIGSSVLAAAFGWGWFMEYLHDGPEAHKFVEAGFLLKITFPYLWFITITALFSAVLNTWNRFAVPALTPCLLNVSIIAAALFLSPRLANPEEGLAWGIFAGGVIQLLFQIPFVMRLRLMSRPRFAWNHPGVKQIRTLMIPALFGVSVNQINILVNTTLATFLATGSISYLYYSDRLLEFPLGMFAVAISTVILPALAKVRAAGDMRRYADTMDWGIRSVVLLGCPAMAGMIALREPIICVLFMHGSFSEHDAIMAGQSLFASSLGILSLMLARVAAPGFHAVKDMKTPVRYGIIAMIANIIFNLALTWPLGYIGLALSTALSGTVNAWCLMRGLSKRGIYTPPRGTWILSVRLIIAALVMAGAVWWLSPDLSVWASWSTAVRTAALAGLIFLGAAVYAAAAFAFGLRLRDLKADTEAL